MTDSPTPDLDDRLVRHLDARVRDLDVPTGDVDRVRHLSAGIRRRHIATRSIAAVAAAAAVVIGAVTFVNGTGEPRSSVDVAGPPEIGGDAVSIGLEPVVTTGLDGTDLLQIVTADDGYVALATTMADGDSKFVASEDGIAWTDLDLPGIVARSGGQLASNGSMVAALVSVGPDGSPASVYLHDDVEWRRVDLPPAMEPGQIAVTRNGTVFVMATRLTDNEIARRAADQALADAIAERWDDTDGYSWSSGDGEALDTEIQVSRGDLVVGTTTLGDLGLDRTEADLIVNSQPDFDAPMVLRIDGDTLTPLDPPAAGDAAGDGDGDVHLAGDVVIAGGPDGSAQWSSDGATWTPVPAGLAAAGYVTQVLSSDLGSFAVTQGDRTRFFRADSLAGPWNEITVPSPDDSSYSTLNVSDHAVVLSVQDHGATMSSRDTFSETGTEIGTDSGDDTAAIPADAYSASVELDRGDHVIVVSLDGPLIVRDRSGAVVLSIESGEFDAGTDSMKVDVATGVTTLFLPSGEELRVTDDEVLDALTAQRPEYGEYYRTILGVDPIPVAGTTVPPGGVTEMTVVAGEENSSSSSGGAVTSASSSPIGELPPTTVYVSTDGRRFSPVSDDLSVPQFVLRFAGGLVVSIEPSDEGGLRSTLWRFTL